MNLRLRHGRATSGAAAAARLYDGYGTEAWLGYLAAWPGDAAAFELYALPTTRQTLLLAARERGVALEADWPAGGTRLTYVLPNVLAPVGAEVTPPITEEEATAWTAGRKLLWLPGAQPAVLPAALDLARCFAPLTEDTAAVLAPPPPHRPPMRLGAIEAPAPEVDLETRIRELAEGRRADGLEPLSPEEELKREALRRLLKGGRLSRFLARQLASGDDPQAELDELERRSGDDVERLERLFEEDPMAALRHSAPLDTDDAKGGGFGAGSDFQLREYWRRLGLNAPERNSARGGGGMESGQFDRLRALYEAQASKLGAGARHEEAAFVYLKLLNDPRRAAAYLKDNGLYLEAADTYLRHAKQPLEAAECYRLAHHYTRAIPLYEEALAFEPAGDCARAAGLEARADILYRKGVRAYVAKRELLEAEALLSQKLGDVDAGTRLLDQGWREDIQASLCLRRYLKRLDDTADQLAYLRDTRGLMSTAARQVQWMRGLRAVHTAHQGEAHEAIWRAGLEMASHVGKANPAVFEELIPMSSDPYWAREAGRARATRR